MDKPSHECLKQLGYTRQEALDNGDDSISVAIENLIDYWVVNAAESDDEADTWETQYNEGQDIYFENRKE